MLRDQRLNQSQWVSYKQGSFEEIRATLSELELNLINSHKLQTKLRLKLMENSKKRSELELRLEKEKSRNKRLIDVMRGVDSSADSSPRTSLCTNRTNVEEAEDTVDTISLVLMQYRYDELYVSHKRCLKLLSQKERMLKEALCENEMIQAKFDEVLSNYKTLQEKMEMLCCKYLGLQVKKTEEIFQLKEALNHAVRIIVMHFKQHHGEPEICQLKLFLQALHELNFTADFTNCIKSNV